ncbi:hypothetical protein LCGC14_1104770 [marine sediment metagenome]|uniref:Uncharacterized protein n=1 Tax=marine sediment metagenome TaxID=412755 RepID=A0A0F9QEQ0_9ZZZZ
MNKEEIIAELDKKQTKGSQTEIDSLLKQLYEINHPVPDVFKEIE